MHVRDPGPGDGAVRSADKNAARIVGAGDLQRDAGNAASALQLFGKLIGGKIDVARPQGAHKRIRQEKSNKYEYTPVARWKTAPEIVYNSQDGEGSVFLSWSHDDNGLGCEYKVIQYEKLLVVKKGEKVLGTTTERKFEISDLVNGKYTFAVVPILGQEEGSISESVTVEVKAEWIVAPELQCSINGPSSVKLTWSASPKVETYHITVYAGSGSLLRFVNLDFKKVEEFDVPVKADEIIYEYQFPDSIDPETGVKLRFEIFGVRHTADNSEQTSSISKQTVILNK